MKYKVTLEAQALVRCTCVVEAKNRGEAAAKAKSMEHSWSIVSIISRFFGANDDTFHATVEKAESDAS